MRDDDYARDGWHKAPEELAEATGRCVRMGLLRVVEHGDGYFKLSGRGLRVVTDESTFKSFPMEIRYALQHFKTKRDEMVADVERKREAQKIQGAVTEAQKKADNEEL